MKHKMRIKKKHIIEKIDPKAVANQAREIVDAVSQELNSDDKTAQEFVKSMTIAENANAPHVVEFVRELKDETPFVINGVKWEFVIGKYPNGKNDIAVYRFDHDLAYDHDWFMSEVIPKPNRMTRGINESNKKVNPWAICTSSVGRDDKNKYEACVKSVKSKYGISEALTEDEFGTSSRGIQYDIKPEPSVSDADKKALKIGEPKKKNGIKYGEKDLPFESEIRENKVNRTVIKTIKVKDLNNE